MKTQQWYCNVNLKPQGPFSLEEIRARIHRGEVGPQDLICDETSSWKAANEWGIFEFHLFPASQEMPLEVDMTTREWVLLSQTQEGVAPLQQGPFSIAELREMLLEAQISPYQYVWKTGLSGWCQLKDRSEFYSAISSERLSNPSPV